MNLQMNGRGNQDFLSSKMVWYHMSLDKWRMVVGKWYFFGISTVYRNFKSPKKKLSQETIFHKMLLQSLLYILPFDNI